MDVIILWHVHHSEEHPDGPPRDSDGDIEWDDDTDDLKLIGVYSSGEEASAAMLRTAALPGFRDEPDCFIRGGHRLDEDHWTDGFVTVGIDDESGLAT